MAPVVPADAAARRAASFWRRRPAGLGFLLDRSADGPYGARARKEGPARYKGLCGRVNRATGRRRDHPGLTTARKTAPSIRTKGISFMIRQKRSVRGRSPRPNFFTAPA